MIKYFNKKKYMYTIYDLHIVLHSIGKDGENKILRKYFPSYGFSIVEELSDKAVEILVRAHKKLDGDKA